MARFDISLDIAVQDAEFQLLIAEAIKKTGDLRKPFEQISREWFKGNLSFSNQASKPNIWADYRPKYAARKAKIMPLYPMLKWTGALYRSITDQKDAYAVSRPGRFSLEVGSDIPYGMYHQYGTSKMPTRPFVFAGPEQITSGNVKDVSNERLDRWKDIISSWIMRKL